MALPTNKATLQAIRESLGLEAEDNTRDVEIANMAPEEQFDAFLTWHGIINWSDAIHRAHTDIFGMPSIKN